MSLTDCQIAEVSQFLGAWLPSATNVDDTRIPLEHGRAALNVQFPGADSTSTRFGHQSVFSPGVAVKMMLNWLFNSGSTPKNYLVWWAAGVGLKGTDLSTLTSSTLIADTASSSAVVQQYGARLYTAFLDANGLGRTTGQVYGYSVSAADPLFAAPISTVPTFSELGAGITTPGAKLFGYVIQTRNGYITKPSPSSGGFTGTGYTSLGGVITLSVDPPAHTWPSYALKVAPIATTTANPNQFFIVPSPVAGADPFYTITAGAATLMLMAVTDSALTANGIDATPYLLQIDQSAINPSFIYAYGTRVGYITLDAAGIPVSYISDPSNPQSVNAALNAVYLPGQLRQVAAFALRESLYILGPHWTYSTHDTGTSPATWAIPQLVDGAIGVLGPYAVALNASQNYCWVADEGGLYLFTGGSYPSRPVSYYQRPDWSRINFAAPLAIKVVDDSHNQRVTVLAPLDGATTASHELIWDYSNGTEPETIKYCLASISGYSPGAIAMVQNETSKHLEKWIAPGDATKDIGREMSATDTNPYRDFGAAITSQWETSIMPRDQAGRLIQHHAGRMRLRGAGTLTMTVWSLDHGRSVGPFSIGLSNGAALEYLQRFFLMNEYVSVAFSMTGQVDGWFMLASYDHFWTFGPPTR